MKKFSALFWVLFFAPLISINGQSFDKITDSPVTAAFNASRAVTWIDFDNDDDLDLFVTNGPSSGQDNLLFRNNGAPDYTFTKVDTGILVNDNGRSDGASWADFNNDGRPDLFVANWYGDNNFLYLNGLQDFQLVTGQAVVANGGLSETGSWGDFDNDGLVDLFVANSGDAGSTGPQQNWLYHNQGDGNFARVNNVPPTSSAQYTRGVNWIDVDDDGDADLFIVNESNQRNRLYLNQLKETGSADWIEVTTGDIVTAARSTWSASWGDYDNDGDADCFVANWSLQNNALYTNDGNGNFTAVTGDIIVSDGGYSASSGWADFDNDGDLDLYVTSAYAPTPRVNVLYQNQLMESGSPTFTKISGNPATDDSGNSFGFAWGDYDKDGDQDIYVARTLNESQQNVFYRNQAPSGNNWLVIDCAGTSSNFSAIGAKVYCRAVINGTPVWQRRDISGQDGYCGQNLQVHFGLGNASVVDSLLIEWPGGETDLYRNLTPNQHLAFKEGDSPLSINTTPLPAQGFQLHQNYPNPFNPQTTITFHLPVASLVTLEIYNNLGQLVQTPLKASQTAGIHKFVWKATNAEGNPLPSGLYYYRVTANGSSKAGKMLLIR